MTKNLDKEGLSSIADNYQLFYVDLWGVVHNGVNLHLEAIKALKENMEKQIKLTKDLNNKLTIAEENNKKISKILAETDIVKNSIADPAATEKKINEEVVNMFNGINTATK